MNPQAHQGSVKRDILTPMNYRRGSQRLYVVMTGAWIGLLLLALPSYRVRFWVAPIDYGKYGVVTTPTGDWFKDNAPKSIVTQNPDSFEPDPPTISDSRVGKALWLLVVTLGPPAMGYIVVFVVVPWIFRGFRGTQI